MNVKTIGALLTSALSVVPVSAHAANARDTSSAAYPVRPVRVVVAFAPGGADVPGRMIAQKLSERFGQPFVVDNRPGAASILGTDIAAKATPDGYTLLFGTASLAVTPVYYRKLPYDPIRDFAPIAFVGNVPFSLATHPSVPAPSMKEFIAYARSRSGQLNYGTPGTGSIGHLANVLLLKEIGAQATHIAYKGTGPTVTALIGGEIQFAMPNLVGALPHMKSGKLRVLGVASVKRVPSAPAVPTFSESGIRNAESGTWYGVLAPRGTPQAIVDRLNREIVAQLQTPELREQFAGIGVVPESGTPQQFAAFIREEIEKWGGVMQYAGMKKENY
jgi:tripartite-type tricarboxylate transporter receptor subunit TctC